MSATDTQNDTSVNRARYCWAFPATVLGLALAALALRGGRIHVVDGVVEAHGPWLQWVLTTCVPLRGGAAAITLGHVVVGQNERAIELTRPHERVHVRQYERWGPLFLLAYPIASLYATLCGGHYYFDNAFEREASATQTFRSSPPIRVE